MVGATGATGRRVARHAAERGLGVVLAGRDRSKLDDLAAQVDGAEVRRIDLAEPDTLDQALEGSAVALSCVGPFARVGLPVAEAAVRAGVHYVDVAGEPRFCLALVDRLDDAARARGVTLVTAAAASSMPADLAAASGLARVDLTGARELTLAYRVRGMRPSAGSLRSVLEIMADGAVIVRDGQLEVVAAGGKVRRLPAGPGVRFAVPDPVVVSRHCTLPAIEAFFVTPGAAVVGPSLHASEWVLARPALRNRVRRIADKMPNLDDGHPHGTFAVEATVWGRWGAHSVTATTHDVYGFTARAMTLVAAHLAHREGDGGVRAPSQVVDDVEKAAVDLGLELEHRQFRPGEPF